MSTDDALGRPDVPNGPHRSAGRVVVGYDGSGAPDPAIDWAARAARIRGEPLLLVTAAHPLVISHEGAALFDTGLIETSSAFLRDELARAGRTVRQRFPGLLVETRFEVASPAHTLIEASAAADVVVLGRRTQGRFGGVAGLIGVLGGVAEAVASHARGPVAVVPDGASDERPGPVVVGLESQAMSYRVLEVAGRWARDTGRELLLLHAWDVRGPWRPDHLADADRIREVNMAWEAVMADEVDRLRGQFPGVPIRTEVTTGSAVDALVERSAGASVVVVGTRGHGGFAGLLLGSTSRRVLQTAACPVIVVPTPPPAD